MQFRRALFLDRVRVLVVRFGDALPFAVDLQQQKNVREVDLAAPALFENAHDSKRLLEFKNVDARLEVVARAEGVGLPEGAQRLSREAVTRPSDEAEAERLSEELRKLTEM